MQTDNRFFDDLAKVAGGALGTLTGLKTEMEAMFRQQFERILSEMDVVPREEFEAVRAMAVKAREENEALAKRVAALENQIGNAPAKAAPAKPAAKRAAPKGKGKGPAQP